MLTENEWPKWITLTDPIMVTDSEGNKKEVKELKLQKPMAVHLKFFPVGEKETSYYVVPLVAALTGIKQAEADTISLSDMLRMVEVLVPFLGTV